MKNRLDSYIKEHHLLRSRSSAKDLIKRGFVKINQKVVKTPSYIFKEGDIIEITKKNKYVSRGADKLISFLENIEIEDNERSNDYDFTKTNYDNQANQLLAKNLKGKLLLAHGNLDNNVPPYNTLLVVDELIKANKDFDLIIFPNKRHGFGDQNNYFMRRKWDYFVEHLKGLDPPKNFSLTF